MGENARGVTLLEALVGALILQLILLGVAPLFIHALRYNAAAADIGTTVAAAVQRLEQLRATNYGDLAAGGSLVDDVSVGGRDYFDASDPRYVVRWEVRDVALPRGAKRVAVRALALRRVTGRPKDVVLTTIRGGP